MKENFAMIDNRPIEERLAELPAVFQSDFELIRGVTFRGIPKQAGSDNHAHTPDRRERPTIYADCHFLADGAAEALKFSRHWKVACVGCEFVGGAEEPVDICRGGDLYFLRCDFVSVKPEGRDVTLKGGARRVTFDRCSNLRQITAGQYSKYDARAIYPGGRIVAAGFRTLARPPVRETRITGCGPMRFIAIHSERPIADPDCRVVEIPKPAVPPYFWARAKFFQETLLVPPEEFLIDPREVES